MVNGETSSEPHREPPRSEGGLDSLREQLYARGAPDPDLGRTDLSAHRATPAPVPVWRSVPETTLHTSSQTPSVSSQTHMGARMKRRNRIRMVLLGGGAVFFMVAAVLASAYIFFGRNTISGNNITLEARGPFAVGGGERFDFTVSLTNQNVVPIEQATLIIEYPRGTQSATDAGRDLFRDRKPLNSVGPGEVLTIPASALVFGEENEEKKIGVTIEYRVQGSNATFFREATPLMFKISSSPVTMTVDAVRTVTSGQEATFTMTLQSNSPTPLEGLLVKAEYPSGFSFSSSEPKPVAGEDSWRIATLKPEEKRVIVVKGLMTGRDPETRTFKFSAGVANDKDPYALSSVFTTKTHDLVLEQAFVALSMSVNGKSSETVIISPRESVLMEITFTNTLADTIHDAVIEAELSGNALNESTVSAGTGFYDSTKNRVRWDSVDTDGLKEIVPGGSHTVTFSVSPLGPDNAIRTPEIRAKVNVAGKRVSDRNAAETLMGTVQRIVKIETQTSIASQVFYADGPFSNTGPVPPVAEVPTTYSVIMALANGSNPLSDAVVEAVLPQYVTWTNKTQAADGSLSYNASTRVVSWKVADLEAAASAAAAFQVSITPSKSQTGSVPALVTEQRLRAKDRFTESTVRATTPDITTQLSDENDESKREGRVRAGG
jgi:hypothetical protein